MRFDTHRVSAFLVEEMHRARPHLEVIIDDGDIIHVRTLAGDTAALYMVETAISAAEIRYHVETNSATGIYTLFVLWGELLMPAHGTRYRPHDWMTALLALHGDKIYAFDPYGGDQLVFPVHFDREAGKHARGIRHGAAVHPAHLSCFQVRVNSPGMSGTWRVADFNYRHAAHAPDAVVHDFLTPHLSMLGVERRATPEATRAVVKRAYRKLARLHHPDVNDQPGSEDMMRRINEAYTFILESLDTGV